MVVNDMFIEMYIINYTYFYSDNELRVLNNNYGPAFHYIGGLTAYCKNGKYHNELGPAIINDGVLKYYIKGKRLEKDNWEKIIKTVMEGS